MRARIKYAYAQNSTGRAQCGLSGGAQKRALTCTANTAGSQYQCQCQLPTADSSGAYRRPVLYSYSYMHTHCAHVYNVRSSV